MNGTDPSIPAPVEDDRIDVSDEWREHALDRRGRGTPRPVQVDPEAPQRLKALFADQAERLEPLIQGLDVPACAPPIRAGIADEADPTGAALAVSMLARVAPGLIHDIEDMGRDAWIGTHGLAFACQATVEMIGYEMHYWDRSGKHGRVSISEPNAQRVALINGHLHRIARLRSILAALPDSEYAVVRDAVAAQRTTEAKRFGAALLMPDQEDWVREALDLHNAPRRRSYGGYDLVWAVASTPEHAQRAGATVLYLHGDMVERIALLVDALGTDALPVLVNTLDGEDRPSVEVREHLYDAISRIPTDAALTYLLSDLTNPLAATAAAQAARRFPVRTLRAILSIAPNAHAATKVRLAGFARKHGLLETADALNEAERERLADLVHRRHPDAETLPAAFATPPWTLYAKPASKRAALDLEPPATRELLWAPGEQEAWQDAYQNRSYWSDPSRWEGRWSGIDDPKDYGFSLLVAFGPEERARAAFARWDGMSESLDTTILQAILARFGAEATSRTMALLKRKSSFREALMPFVNLDAARLSASWLSRSRNERATARTWLDRHRADAAALLIPDAVGKDAKLRKAAIEALRYLDRSVVDEQAASYGEEAAAAAAALLDADPLDPQVARIPKPGAWAEPQMLPQVLLADRSAALPEAAVRTLMTALAMDEAERLYPGVEILAAECDRASLTAFSWGLFELWLSAGSPSKDSWAMDQLRRFADDYAVRRLTALIRAWPGQSQNRKAVRGLEILGWVGSESALRAVHGIAQNAKYKALKKTATEQIEVIAERLDLTLDQLGDRLVPDFGLGEESLVLDYGPRRFTVKFDEALKPFVLDEKGKRLGNAPKPNAKDDPELALPAHERFAALRRDLKATAAEQVKRLEAAMGSARTWTGAEFQEFLVDHPLMWQLSSRLVWQAGGAAFRLAEDRTLADAEDEPFALPEDAVVRLAHPLTLGDEVEAWASVFADYEILQPFEQLGRPAFELSEEERKAGRLARFEGAKAGGGPLIGLLNRGWKFGGPEARRGGYGLYREFPEGGYVHVESDPGVYPGYGYDNSVEQTLTAVELVLPEDAVVDPVAISEVLLVVSRSIRSA